MDVIIHKKIEELEIILPKWKRLKEEFHEVTVFQDISWIKSWWEYKKEKKLISPYIVEIKKEDETIGIIPLYSSSKKFASLNFKVLKPIGSELSDYLVPILSKKVSPEKQLKEAFKKIHEDKANWDYIDWSDIPEDSTFDRYLSSNLSKKDSLSEGMRTFICPFLILNNNFELTKLKYDQKLVKEILKKERKLKRNGDLEYNLVTEENDIEPIMNEFFDLHCERWAKTDTPSRYELREEREYSLKAARNLFESNLLHLSYLKYNDDIVAVEFAMSDERKVYLYLTAFNMKYKKYSVGNILLYNLIRDACKNGYDIVDFTRGGESYKQQWGTIEKFNVRYILFNKSVRSFLYRMIRNTYHSKHFKKKSIIIQVIAKSYIRAITLLLSTIDKFNSKKGLRETNLIK